MTGMPTDLPTKQCAKCGQTLPLTSFAGRQRTCIPCRDAQRARTLERKDHIAYTSALADKIVDLIAMGSTITEVAAMSGMPTARQMAAWRRAHPEFRDAYEEARVSRADARSDRVDAALRDLAAGKITAADCRVIVETELKMMAKENPGRFGDRLVSDITVRPGSPVEKPDTAAWIDKVLGPAAAAASNVVPLLPAPDEAGPEASAAESGSGPAPAKEWRLGWYEDAKARTAQVEAKRAATAAERLPRSTGVPR